MAEETARFTLKLEDQTSGAASSAAAALGNLQAKLKADTKALGEMQAAMRQMQSASVVNVDAFKNLQSRIEKQKQAIASSQQKFIELGGRFGKNYQESKKAEKATKSLGESMAELPGPIGQIGAKLRTLTGGLPLVAVGAAAVVAGFVALTGAVVAAGAAVAAFGAISGNARRSEALHFEAIARMRRGFVGMRAGASEVQGAIDQVAGSTATSREQVARFAEILQRGGVRGANLTTALRAASTRAAALGDESGAAFAQMAVGARRSGVSIQRLADDVQSRFGNIASRRLLDLDVIGGKLKESFGALFNDINFEPLLKAVKAITDLFSQSTASGRAIKAIVTSLFRPLIGEAGDASTAIVAAFKSGLIWGLRLQIQVQLLRLKFRNTFGPEGLQGYIDTVKGSILSMLGPLGAVIGAAQTAQGLATLHRGANQQGTMRTQGQSAGQNLSSGVANGIRSNASRAVNAARDLGRQTTAGLRNELEIHSPSRVFAELGEQIPAGVEMGIDRGADRATAAARDMVKVPVGTAGRSGGSSVSIGEIHIHAATNDPAEFAAAFRAKLGELLEGAAIEMGAVA